MPVPKNVQLNAGFIPPEAPMVIAITCQPMSGLIWSLGDAEIVHG